MEPDEHSNMMARHRARRDEDWIPYHARRSDGQLKFIDDGAKVTVIMEVASLGTLVLSAEAKFSDLHNSYKWDQAAELRAKLK